MIYRTAILLLLLISGGGCASMRAMVDPTRQMKPEYLYMHGKVGRVTGGVAYWLALPADVVLLPITFPVGAYIANHQSDKGMFVVFVPGAFLQSVFYSLGAGVVYPVHVLAEGIPETLRERHLQGEERNNYIQTKWPHLTEAEYNDFVRRSGRTNALPYVSQYDEYGSGSFLFYLFRFGTRPLVAGRIVRDWERWEQESNQVPEDTARKLADP